MRDAAEEQAAALLKAVKLLAQHLDRGATDSLALAHQEVEQLFEEVTTPRGRRDNAIEQRLVGTLWAEMEQALDERRRKKK